MGHSTRYCAWEEKSQGRVGAQSKLHFNLIQGNYTFSDSPSDFTLDQQDKTKGNLGNNKPVVFSKDKPSSLKELKGL